jgi:acyl-CoA thioester hydrolase
MGVVHHAAYIPWLELGRTELLRDAGVSYAELEAAGVFLVIVKLDVSYKRPAFYDDVVEVRTRVLGPASRVKIRHEYEVVRFSEPDASKDDEDENRQPTRRAGPPGEVLLTGTSLLACVDKSGRPAGLPEWLMVGE